MQLNALQKALVNKGFAEQPKPNKKRAGKPVRCRKCGKNMVKVDDMNVAYCSNCDDSYIVFDKNYKENMRY